jgi:ADP-ribose pyrophosphatase
MIETLHETRWLKLQRDGRWDFVRRPDSDHAVGILAITPQDEVLLVEQLRIPVQKRTIELPAGIVGDEPEHRGEALAETARRELLEETGYRAGKIEELVVSPTSAGMTAEITHLFLARELEKAGDGGGVGHEEIEIHHVPLAEIRSWIAARQAGGTLVDFKIQAALWAAGFA